MIVSRLSDYQVFYISLFLNKYKIGQYPWRYLVGQSNHPPLNCVGRLRSPAWMGHKRCDIIDLLISKELGVSLVKLDQGKNPKCRFLCIFTVSFLQFLAVLINPYFT